MHYALDFRTFLFSHYFYRGLRIACGVIGMTLAAMHHEDITITMTVFLGALCVSLMDLPSPLRHKFNEMAAGLLLCTLVMLSISLCSSIPILMYLMMVIVCFLASMMLIYGKKTISLQFAALLVMTLSMTQELSIAAAFEHTLFFALGGTGYLVYSMIVSYLLRFRFKQQILAEALFELAQYLNIKSGFYDTHTDLNTQFNKLVRHQITLADKQQAARDLILRGIIPEQDGRLIQVHLSMLEVYEHILSMHADYELLREHFGGEDVMMFLRDLAQKTRADIEAIAYAVTRNRTSVSPVNYKAELRAIAYEMQVIEQDTQRHVPAEAITILRATHNKIRDMIELIGRLHQATRAPVDAPSMFNNENSTPFLTQQKFKFSLMRSHLHMRSPFFRFSIRMALAVMCGLAIADNLPYSTYPHWIILTIVITLKPNFSSSRQRLNDRLIGTLIGCIVAVLVLKYITDPAALIGIMFLASIAAPAFITIKYRYTAIASSIQILILMNLLMPESHVLVVGERAVDTIIGVTISAAFGYFLPSWEYQTLPRQIQNVLEANRRFIQSTRDMFGGKVNDDFFYRIARKDFMNTLAALIDTIVRMSAEPQAKQKAITELNRFVVQNYLVAAHIAALRIIVRRYGRVMPQEEMHKLIARTLLLSDRKLGQANRTLRAYATQVNEPEEVQQEAPEAPDFVLESETAEIPNWSGWHTLQRRTDLLSTQIVNIVRHSEAISHALYQKAVADKAKST